MESFVSIPPSSILTPYIREYWFLSADCTYRGMQRALPSGNTGLIFNRGGTICSEQYGLHPEAYLFGQSVKPVDISFDNLNIVIVVFRPVGIRMLLNVPGNEIRGQYTGLDLINRKLQDLGSRLLDAPDKYSMVGMIENFLISQLISSEDYNFNRFNSVIRSIGMGESNISVLADRACLGYKQFQRLFAEYTGLNPKEYIQVNRFSKTLQLLQTHPSANLNEIAYKCGYYDKSHLIRQVKRYSSYTPTEFLLNTDPYSDDRLLFQSSFVHTGTNINHAI